ncbi:hydrogenase maturation protease [Aeromicrobium sp.]|uniref:hydrogenase maturation protease n=1 Tax=Aeromicrobium sp. TaxID=1871063 RepID=UPI0030C48906
MGNLFLSDDGFGPEVARLLLSDDELPGAVQVVDYGIRGMHLAYDLLDGCAALVIVDAIPGEGSPGDVVVLSVGPDDVGTGELDAHGMDPLAVLGCLRALGGTLPPTYVVGCRPAGVDEGIGLSPPVAAAVPVAAQAVARVINERILATSSPMSEA